MIVAIHQPNYLPWLGFFDKMARADLFVYLDSVPFTKNGYQNRTRVKTPRGPEWLTVPVVTKGRFGQPTSEVPIDNRPAWARKQLAKLTEAYARTPGWAAVRELLEPVLLERSWELMAPLNLALLERLREALAIDTPTVVASSLAARGEASELLVGICQETGGDVYLSGAGARKYMDFERFAKAGIEVRYQEFRHPAYDQPHGPFEPGLSAVDLICAEGVERARAVAGGDAAAAAASSRARSSSR